MLARTFLRLCTLEAVRPSAQLNETLPQWPTMAAGYVFDSRLDPIEDIAADERRPIIVVYTEDDQQDKISQAGPVFYQSAVDLIFEISVIAAERIEADDGGSAFVAGTAYTDAELEASLDALENQIWHALHFGPSGALFRQMAKLPMRHWHSMPQRSSEEGFRLAMRTIKTRVDVKEICYQAMPTAPPTGFDRLPPALRSIAAALDGSTYLATIAAGVAGAAPVMPVRVPLDSVAGTFDPRRPDAPPDSNAIVRKTIEIPQG